MGSDRVICKLTFNTKKKQYMTVLSIKCRPGKTSIHCLKVLTTLSGCVGGCRVQLGLERFGGVGGFKHYQSQSPLKVNVTRLEWLWVVAIFQYHMICCNFSSDSSSCRVKVAYFQGQRFESPLSQLSSARLYKQLIPSRCSSATYPFFKN